MSSLPLDPVVAVGLALATALVAWKVVEVAWDVVAADWPTSVEPLTIDNRGLDHRLGHLVRLLGATDLHDAHRELVAAVERILVTRYAVSLTEAPTSARTTLGDDLYMFVIDPPLSTPHGYHRALRTALSRIEQL